MKSHRRFAGFLPAGFVHGLLAPAIVAALAVGTAHAGEIVESSFEPGEPWSGTAFVFAASWPDAFNGGYALQAQNTLEFKRWPLTGTFAEPVLSLRLHFRVEADNLGLDPDHDESPGDLLTLVGVEPRLNGTTRPTIGIKRNDDMLVLRVQDYATQQLLKHVVIVPDQWHVLDVVFDQPNHRLAVALDGLKVFDDRHAAVDIGQPFTFVQFGLVFASKNGNSLWFDDVRLTDTGVLQGPELDASATATPGVGVTPLLSQFEVTTTAGSPTIEWDFDGDGTFDGAGANDSHSFPTIGTWRPVARVTDGQGRRAAAYPPVIHALDANAPQVALAVEQGGASDLPFPRTFAFRADLTPRSGSKIIRLEFDWDGGGVFGFWARTPWSLTAPHTVRYPHRYQSEATRAVVRARATDDAGRAGVAEVVLDLPLDAADRTPMPRDARAGIYLTYGWDEIFLNRGRAFPPWLTGMDVSSYFNWSEIETADGFFDFGLADGSDPFSYNGRIREIIDGGLNVILRHRAYFPAWLFTKVAKSNKKNLDGNDYPQFWDPRFQVYFARFVQASAANLQGLLGLHPDWNGRFVLSRGQSFSVDSENIPTGSFPVVAFPGTSAQMNLVAANFTPPAGGAYPVDHTSELATAYAAFVRSLYQGAFGPLGIPAVFKPHAGGWYNGTDAPRADDEFRRGVANASQGFFVTNARADTCHDHWFLGFVDRGFAKGFHEMDNNAGSVLDTVQWQYWTMLAELNAGSEYVGIWGDYAWLLEYQAEYDLEPVHAFVNRHVGWKAHPGLAPAAWLALKPPTTSPGQPTTYTGLYGAFLREDPHDDGSDATNVDSVRYTYTGPANLGHPTTLDEPMLWARTCPPGGSLRFDLNDHFRAAHATSFDLEIVWFDSYQGVFGVACADLAGVTTTRFIPMSGNQKWRRTVVELRGVRLRNDLPHHADLALHADAQATTFHRIVLTPRDDLPQVR